MFSFKNTYYRYILSTIFVFFNFLASGTNYYISSSSGDDSNPGTSEKLAWKSINRLNNYFKLGPGDKVLFKRGDEFTGTIICRTSGSENNPIEYGAYGSGDKPIIYGSEEVDGWTQYNGNIFKTKINKVDIQQLFINGLRMKIARYPDSGYFKITNTNGSNKISSSDLDGNMNYAGATCIFKNNAFTLLSREIRNSSSQSLTIASRPVYNIKTGYGFWLCNKLEFLTTSGEWFFDNSAKILYFWTPNGDSPGNYKVRVSTTNYGIYISNLKYINIKDLEIMENGIDGIKLVKSDHITIDNCNIINTDLNAVEFTDYDCNNITVKNCRIKGANGRGIAAYGEHAVITGNIIEETGQIENINKVADGMMGTGISSRNDNGVFEYNKIINSGYSGINFQGLNTIVRFNYVNGACQVLDDGGGIYITSSSSGSYPKNERTVGSVIDHNIVFNVYGNRTGSLNNNNDSGVGIYLDWAAKGVTVTNNTISGTTYGMLVNGGGLNKIKHNTIMNSMLMLRFKDESIESDNIEFKNNILYQTSRLGKHAYITTETHQKLMWPNETGTTFENDSNIYIAPYYSATIFKGSSNFEDWKADTRTDSNSRYEGKALPDGETEMLFYNDTKSIKIFHLEGTIFSDASGLQVIDTFSLQPFTSKILIGKNLENVESETTNSPTKQGSTEIYSSVSTNASKRAMPVTIDKNGEISSISIYHNGGDGKVLLGVFSDESGMPSSLIGITPATNVNSYEGWQTISLKSPVAVNVAQTIWLAWVFENNPGIRYTIGKPGRASSSDTWQNQLTSDFGEASIADYIYSIYCTYSTQTNIPEKDSIKPVVSGFSIPASSSSLVVSVSSFSASDNKEVTGYLITESGSAPAASNESWATNPPSSYAFTSEGNKTLYAWAKDQAGNVSDSKSAIVTVSVPDNTKPVVSGFSIPASSSSLVVSVSSFSASDNKEVTGYLITESGSAPAASNESWATNPPSSYAFTSEGNKTLYAWAKDQAGNVSDSKSAIVTVTILQETTVPDETALSQSIELKKGWNIVSSYLVPDNKDMAYVTYDIRTGKHLIKVLDELGNTYSQPNAAVGWVNEIGDFQKTEGYKIRVWSDCILEITGTEVQLPLNIDIREGENFISFPINGSLNAMEVIQSLIDDGIVDKVLDEKGNSIENWRKQGWKNGIGDFQGGEGYVLIATGNSVLTINNIVSTKSGKTLTERFETNHFHVSYDGYGIDHMNINILDLKKSDLKVGDEIAVYDFDICVGAIKLTETDIENNTVSIPASATEINENNGFIDGNSIKLKAWKSESDEQINLRLIAVEGELVFDKYSSVFIQIENTEIISGNSEINLLNTLLYPNPARELVTVSFNELPASGTEIELLSSLGLTIEKRIVQSKNEIFNIEQLSTGIYLIKTSFKNDYKVQKFIKR